MYAVQPFKLPRPFANGSVTFRQQLTQVLSSDGNTVANYRPGTGVTGTLTASAWANQMGAAGSLEQATAGNQPIYLAFAGEKYAYCPNVAVNGFSTPSAAANQITGDIQFIFHVASSEYATQNQELLGRDGVGQAYAVQLSRVATTAKTLTLLVWQSTAAKTATSSAGLSTADGSDVYIKITLAVATGKVNFYTSSDGITWTILGVEQTITAAATDAGTSELAIGAAAGGTFPNPFFGKIYRAQIYNGIDGTLAVDFNAADWPETSTNAATQVSSTTGETWTLNNTAVATPAAIVGSSFIVTNESDRWMRSTYTANQPRTIYLVGMDPVWAAGKYILDGVTANTLGLSKTTATPKISLNAGAAAAEDANLALRAKGIVTIVLNGASSSIQVNSNAATTGNAGAGNPGGLTIGADGGTPTAGTFGGFWYSEILDRDGADSATTQAKIQALLKSIHGTP